MLQNKGAVKRYYSEIWNRGNLDLIDELMTADYENCDPATPGGVIKGTTAFKSLVTTYREAFPDINFDIVEQYMDGDVVVSRWKVSATHRGAVMGVPPTGKHADGLDGVTISTFRDGRIMRDRVVWDLAGLLRVIGALPA